MERNDVNGNQLGNKMIELIKSVAKKVFKKLIKGYPKEWVAQVVTATVAPNAVATVYLNADTSQPTMTFKNKSWETLSSGDECYVHSPSGSLSDAVILYKK